MGIQKYFSFFTFTSIVFYTAICDVHAQYEPMTFDGSPIPRSVNPLNVVCIVGNARALPGAGYRDLAGALTPSKQVEKFELSTDPAKTGADTRYLQFGLNTSVSDLKEAAKHDSHLSSKIADLSDQDIENLVAKFSSAKHFRISIEAIESEVRLHIEREIVYLRFRGASPVDESPVDIMIPSEKFGLPYVIEDLAVICQKISA